MSILNVLISGGGGRIAYSLIPLICRGDVFGKLTKISLRLLDVEASRSVLQGVKLEIEDCGYDLVIEVIATTDTETACQNVDVAILLGGHPRLPGMERKDLILKNAEGLQIQARALNSYANRNCKTLVVANPANTNCLVAIHAAPDLASTNFSCLTRLDEERLRGFCAEQVNTALATAGSPHRVTPSEVSKIGILGNHSSTQVPYLDQATVLIGGMLQPLKPYVQDLASLTCKVQNRGAEILSTLKASSALSCAAAIEKHLQDWLGIANPRNDEYTIFSMGILTNQTGLGATDGHDNTSAEMMSDMLISWGVPEGLVFSVPCVRSKETGAIHMAPLPALNADTQVLVDMTIRELLEEKQAALAFL